MRIILHIHICAKLSLGSILLLTVHLLQVSMVKRAETNLHALINLLSDCAIRFQHGSALFENNIQFSFLLLAKLIYITNKCFCGILMSGCSGKVLEHTFDIFIYQRLLTCFMPMLLLFLRRYLIMAVSRVFHIQFSFYF